MTKTPILPLFRVQGDNPSIIITAVRATSDPGERVIVGKISTTRGGFAAYGGHEHGAILRSQRARDVHIRVRMLSGLLLQPLHKRSLGVHPWT
jgi:hypothetical protein